MALRIDGGPVEEDLQRTIPAEWLQSDSDNDDGGVANVPTQIDTASSDGFLVSSVRQPMFFSYCFAEMCQNTFGYVQPNQDSRSC